jgi:5'(3')-deoxyribonucleotidase
MNKRNLFIDFDGTIANSIKAYCEYYRIMYRQIPDHTKVKRYNLSDQCPLVPLKEVNNIFGSQLFFDCLELMPNAFDVVKKLKDKFNIILCSIGTFKNISYKSLWIEKHLPFIEDAILIRNKNCNMDKSIIDMNSGIIVDDVGENLATSNADIKILFDNDFEWNIGTKYDLKTYDWIEVFNYLLEGQ